MKLENLTSIECRSNPEVSNKKKYKDKTVEHPVNDYKNKKQPSAVSLSK
jgi:hypothetical protein